MNINKQNDYFMRIKIPLSLFLMVMIAGCYKDPSYDQLSSNFTVTTNRDIKADFSTYKTFFISDTVAFTSSNPKDSILVGAEAKTLIDAVKANLVARGYTSVARTAKPDLGIKLGVLKDVDAGVIYPGWWYGYPGWGWGGYPGWDYPYYPYYPWGGVTYVITTGNVITDIIDLKNAASTQKLNILWTSFVGGSLGTTTNVNVQMAVDGINQAFIQSPYLSATK
jgi:hypothetical protein